MARTEVLVEVEGPDPSDDVRILMRQPGTVALPLAKVASGGELARAMLALRLVLTAGPPTLVFDEVAAGIGGEAAVAVGRSLAALGEQPQVLDRQSVGLGKSVSVRVDRGGHRISKKKKIQIKQS